MTRRPSIASLAGLGALALVLVGGCQGQGAFNAINAKLSDITEQQGEILNRIDQLETKIANLPAGGPAPRGAQKKGPQPGKPDPKATYKVAVADTDRQKGPKDAKITLVEWSDFQ